MPAPSVLNFERAAILRDKLQRLETLREQFSRMRFAVETLSFIYTVPGHEGDDRVYVIRRGTCARGDGGPPHHPGPCAAARRWYATCSSRAERSTGAGSHARDRRAAAVVVLVPAQPRRARANQRPIRAARRSPRGARGVDRLTSRPVAFALSRSSPKDTGRARALASHLHLCIIAFVRRRAKRCTSVVEAGWRPPGNRPCSFSA